MGPIRQRGNILFLILLAVVLFAALAYAVTGSQKGQTKDASSEKVKTMSAEILQKATLIENTINRMMLVNGCKDTEISFENTVITSYVNPSAPASKRCHLFDPAGGGLSYPTLAREMFDPTIENSFFAWGQVVLTGNLFIKQVGTDCTDASCNELVFTTQGLTKAVCDYINESLGNGATIQSAYFAGFEPTPAHADFFKGTYDYQTNAGVSTLQPTMVGRRTGCIRRGDLGGYGNPYLFYHVILAR